MQEKGRRIAILFEGRDAAGKGGAIRRFAEHLNPRAMRFVALPKPTTQERGQWYFRRNVRFVRASPIPAPARPVSVARADESDPWPARVC